MSARQLVVLGTASQAPTRYRAHNSYALRWDDQLFLFDPGEGTQRQCILAGVAIARLTGIFVTHFHGDHCLGLPGVIQRRALDARATEDDAGLPPLPVYYPADGQDYLDRMRTVSIFHDTSNLEPRPVTGPGPLPGVGNLILTAAALDHRVATYGYRLAEPDGISLDPDALAAAGLAGPAVGRLVAEGRVDGPQGPVDLADVSRPRRGQSMAFVMDTAPCAGARELADGVDLLVCESTYCEDQADLAARYRHMTAAQAGRLAAEAGARRLVLTHFSARYPDPSVFLDEASAYHDDVVVAEDLAAIDVPPRRGR
ncbi:MAG: ribonuclease Z [Actinomycetota bacterium]